MRPSRHHGAPELADAFERSLNGPMGYLTGLVYTQVLVLLALKADNHGPEAVSRRDRWLTRAVTQAFEMNFHRCQDHECPHEGGPDDDGKISRRVFIVLSSLGPHRPFRRQPGARRGPWLEKYQHSVGNDRLAV